MNKITYCVFIFHLSLYGCAGMAGDVNDAMKIRRSTYINADIEFDESKVIYVKELRGYTYQSKNKSKEKDGILFDDAGKKIVTKEEAIEHIQSRYRDQGFSKSEKVAGCVTGIWVTPFYVVFGVLENIVMLPAYPYISHLRNKLKKESFEYYREGENLFTKGNYSEAREKFFHVLGGRGSLIYNSDIYYKIAETYDKQGNDALSGKYYKTFLEYSIALYPDYFQKYDPAYVDNRENLDKKFTRAEKKLEMQRTVN